MAARARGSTSVLKALRELAESPIPTTYPVGERVALAALQGQARELARSLVREALQGRTVEGAAARLGVSWRTLMRWMGEDPSLRERVPTDP